MIVEAERDGDGGVVVEVGVVMVGCFGGGVGFVLGRGLGAEGRCGSMIGTLEHLGRRKLRFWFQRVLIVTEASSSILLYE